MRRRKRADSLPGDLPMPLAGGLPAEVRVPVPSGLLPAGRTGTKHGYHSADSIEIPTSLTCNVCPLFHVKLKDRRHALACKEGRKNQVCPILGDRQVAWACGLVGELQAATGEAPTASDRIRIEQIIRHRSRVFQVENYLKVAGLLDLKTGTMRNVGERLTTLENALSRSLSEFRQAVGERRQQKPQAPRLEEYLAVSEEEKEGDGEDD